MPAQSKQMCWQACCASDPKRVCPPVPLHRMRCDFGMGGCHGPWEPRAGDALVAQSRLQLLLLLLFLLLPPLVHSLG